MNMDLKLNAGEAEVRSTPASRAGLLWDKRGRLLLTNQRLLFCHHDFALIHEAMDLAEVSYVGLVRNLNLLAMLRGPAHPGHSAVKVVLKNGDTHCFVVPDQAPWISSINASLARVSWEWRTILS